MALHDAVDRCRCYPKLFRKIDLALSGSNALTDLQNLTFCETSAVLARTVCGVHQPHLVCVPHVLEAWYGLKVGESIVVAIAVDVIHLKPIFDGAAKR